MARTTPPSTRNAAPLVAEDGSPETYVTIAATSSTVAKRFNRDDGRALSKNSFSTAPFDFFCCFAAIWGRTRSLEDSAKENSHLFESTVNFREKNYAWTRLENAGRSNELLVGDHPLPPGFKEEPLTHVQAYTVGYDRDIRLLRNVSSAIGAQVSTYGVGLPLQSIYGLIPWECRSLSGSVQLPMGIEHNRAWICHRST